MERTRGRVGGGGGGGDYISYEMFSLFVIYSK